ncbi:hydantoinase B/oxoprolinase family protein [Paraburkholderia sp.]|uniref:hydantoinase B/oxoprolinase family protein n=1 Tax=Paraburkholderia sp. TaxID=1926495 RepID=UPI003C7D7F4E
MSTDIRKVHFQIMWNRLISVVEEQALTLVRTAFSTAVRESGDLSAGVFDEHGNMLAQAVTGTPGHVNAMAEAVKSFIEAIGRDSLAEGDVYLTNDPWKGAGHLHDFTFVTPSFRKGVLVGFVASTAHVVDVGGRGFGPDANEVYEEGIFIPIMRFANRGQVNNDLIHILRHNVREADQVVGDLFSLASCNDIGHERLMSMMDEFSIDSLGELRDYIFENSRAATLAKIAALPPGSYKNAMTVDGYGSPVQMKVNLQVSADTVHADFAGTDGQSPLGINVPLIYTTAYCCYALKCALAPEIPNNHASLAPFTVSAPVGSILNAQHPAPVAVRHVLGHFVPDIVLGALSKMVPDLAPAEGAGALWNIHISVRPVPGSKLPDGEAAQSAEMLMFNSGGSGARATLDGLNATAFPSGVHSVSVEALEQTGPIVIWRKELREGSGGAGRFRGGLGQVIELSASDGHEFHFNAMFDRVDHPARGRAGGEDGAPGRVKLDDGTPMRAKGRQKVPAGRRLVLELPGGGGFGDPATRPTLSFARDMALGYVAVPENGEDTLGA